MGVAPERTGSLRITSFFCGLSLIFDQNSHIICCFRVTVERVCEKSGWYESVPVPYACIHLEVMPVKCSESTAERTVQNTVAECLVRSLSVIRYICFFMIRIENTEPFRSRSVSERGGPLIELIGILHYCI